jgi:hypothetical protein
VWFRGSGLGSFAFLGFGHELRILQRFQTSRFHGAHAIPRHAGRLSVSTGVMQLDQAEIANVQGIERGEKFIFVLRFFTFIWGLEQ